MDLICEKDGTPLMDSGQFEEIDDGGGDSHAGRPIWFCPVCDAEFYCNPDSEQLEAV